MSKVRNTLGWIGIVLMGLISGILEDIMFVAILVPNAPVSWDLTGDMFWVFTVPLAQLMALAVTGTLGWFLLGLRQPARLVTFWLCWTLARTAFLNFANNPPGDILIYLAWIALWCALYGVLARVVGGRSAPTG